MGKKKQDKKDTPTPASEVAGEYHYGVGRRKSAIATVRVYPKGKGRIFVNDKALAEYFPVVTHQAVIKTPLAMASIDSNSDVTVHVKGGGVSGQAEAIRLGIARALIEWQEDLRPVIKAEGLLKRDARVKERKKPGLKRARRAPQWSKR